VLDSSVIFREPEPSALTQPAVPQTSSPPEDKPKAKPLMNKFRKKAKKRAHQAKRKAQKKRRADQLDWSSTSSESDGSDVEWNEDGDGKASPDKVKMDPLTELLREHLPKPSLLDETLRLSPVTVSPTTSLDGRR